MIAIYAPSRRFAPRKVGEILTTLVTPNFLFSPILDDSYVTHRSAARLNSLLLSSSFPPPLSLRRKCQEDSSKNDRPTDRPTHLVSNGTTFNSAQFVESRSARHRLPAAIFQGDPLSRSILSISLSQGTLFFLSALAPRCFSRFCGRREM